MSIDRRVGVAAGVFLLLGVVVLIAWTRHPRPASPGRTAGAVAVNVTSPEDLGPGSLREALFIAASTEGRANIFIKTRRIALKTALPPLVNVHGVSIVAQPPGAEIDASGLTGGPVFDVTGANTSLEGLVVRNCQAAAIQLRATHFRLQASTIDSCDVGVEVAPNAAAVLLEGNTFASDRVGVRFAAANSNTVVAGNSFTRDKVAGLWAVRGDLGSRIGTISVHDNHFSDDHSGVVAGNVPIVIERNGFANTADAAVHLVGAGAVVRGNHISGGTAMGIIAENAHEAIIDNNEFDHLPAYAIMIRGSQNVLVHANRVHDSGYGMAFVLGDPLRPCVAVENTIVEPKFDGIDVIGDSAILRRNQVLRPHALALHVMDFQPPGGQKVRAQPLLEGNNFRANAVQVASDGAGQLRGAARQP